MSSQRNETDKLFSTITHPILKISVNVYINSRGHQKGWFYAEYKSKHFNSETYAPLHKEVMEYLELIDGDMNWKPVMVVSVSRSSGEKHWQNSVVDLSIKVSRFYVAQNRQKQWLMVDWDVSESSRRDQATRCKPNRRGERGFFDYADVDFNVLPHTLTKDPLGGDAQKKYILNFDQKLYDAIHWLGREVHKLGDVLEKMLGTEEGKAAILARSMNLLAAPKKESE